MISHDKQFIFIHPGKCGGTSIKRGLETLSNRTKPKFRLIKPPGHMNLSIAEKIVTEAGGIFENYFKFTMVRNPWDLLVSWYYHYLTAHGLVEVDKPFESWLFKRGLKYKWENFEVFDHVIRLENINSDYRELLKKLSLSPVDLKYHITHNTIRVREKHYSEYYTEHTAAIVHEKYNHVINKFEYKFKL